MKVACKFFAILH